MSTRFKVAVWAVGAWIVATVFLWVLLIGFGFPAGRSGAGAAVIAAEYVWYCWRQSGVPDPP